MRIFTLDGNQKLSIKTMIGSFWFSNWKHIYNCYIFIHIYAYLFCIVLVFRDRTLLTSLIWPGTPYVCCCGFKLVILLHQPPKSKECRLVPSSLGFILEIFKKLRIIPALSLGNVWQLLWLVEPTTVPSKERLDHPWKNPWF